MEITDELLEKLAKLARIEISDKAEMKKELGKILTWMDKLQELDTTDIEPLLNVIDQQARWREDNVEEHMSRKDALSNAPKSNDGFFEVPKVLKNK